VQDILVLIAVSYGTTSAVTKTISVDCFNGISSQSLTTDVIFVLDTSTQTCVDILVLIAVSQLNVSSFPAFAVRGETLLQLTVYVHDGSDVTISVDWDDGGAPSTFFVPVANQTELTFNHTYQTTGTFTVTMS